MSTHGCPEPTCERAAGPVTQTITATPKDIGALEVRRVLPAPERASVGPFVFFDQMGPARLAPGRGLDVRPHPHIGLATVTWLFEGAIRHRDSLGVDQEIAPGAVNWMTAGRGIVHSERTPDALREPGSALHGLQVWLALPREVEEIEPAFVHHPAASLPRIGPPGARLTLVAGTVDGRRSPVETASETLYAVGTIDAGAGLTLPHGPAERAVYVAEGEIELDGVCIPTGTMGVLGEGAAGRIAAPVDARVAVIGGAPLDGERHLWWNFVSSSRERIERAKADWREGRFPRVPGDDEFIPLPDR